MVKECVGRFVENLAAGRVNYKIVGSKEIIT